MQIERFRFVVEMLGITSLVVSLMFVAYELQQTRDMNLAQLEYNRISVIHDRGGPVSLDTYPPSLSGLAADKGCPRSERGPQSQALDSVGNPA